MLMDELLVGVGLAISGLFDLEPIRLCYLNDKLGLDAEQVRRVLDWNAIAVDTVSKAARPSIYPGRSAASPFWHPR